MMVLALHFAITNPGKKILVLAPYESQIRMLFDEIKMLVRGSNTIKDSIHRNIENPFRLVFSNGSMITGYCAGGKNSASGSDKIRGADAHMIVIDEQELIPDKDIEAITPILMSHPDCLLLVSSTPTGKPSKFMSMVKDKDRGFKEFHYISQESPVMHPDSEKFNPKLEQLLIDDCGGKDTATWMHEVLAEFGKQEQGVFMNDKIDASLQQYDMNTIGYDAAKKYIIGVDWNKVAGTHIIVVSLVGKVFKFEKKYIIENSEFVLLEAVDTIINLNEYWNPEMIVVDVGFGSVQIELLKKHGIAFPKSKMRQRIKGIAMQEHIEIRDPETHMMRRTPVKPFLVNALKDVLDQGNLILPMSEDTIITKKDMTQGIVQQMRVFSILGNSIHGMPKYSQGQDHTLTALMLAVGGYVLEHGELNKLNYMTHVAYTPPDTLTAPPKDERELREYLREKSVKQPTSGNTGLASRDLDRSKPLFGYSQRDAGSVISHQQRRKVLRGQPNRGSQQVPRRKSF
jgi:hypothetical protein